MDPTAIIGGAIGIGKGIASLVQRIKARRARRNAPPPKPQMKASNVGQAPTEGTGLHVTGQNPVAQAGIASAGPAIIQPAAQAAGTVKPRGVPGSLDRAKQDFLFQAAMNGDRLR